MKGRALDSPFAFPFKDSLHPDDPPDIQRGSQREDQRRKQDGRRRPLKVTALTIIHIRHREFGEEKNREDQVDDRKDEWR